MVFEPSPYAQRSPEVGQHGPAFARRCFAAFRAYRRRELWRDRAPSPSPSDSPERSRRARSETAVPPGPPTWTVGRQLAAMFLHPTAWLPPMTTAVGARATLMRR